jgi:zinc protease
MPILVAILALAALTAQAPSTAPAILARYVQAVGGEAAMRAVNSRATEGQYDNGRGLNTRFTIVEDAPNRRVTIIGTDPIDSAMGSGRGYDGARGWDKNFIGTGLRVLEGRELADAARDADMLRPLHLLDDCESTAVERSGGNDVIVCRNKAGAVVRFSFDTRTGLMTSQDINPGPRQIHIAYEDYRAVDGLRLPFRTHIDVAGATITYDAASIRQNVPVDGDVFQQPK